MLLLAALWCPMHHLSNDACVSSLCVEAGAGGRSVGNLLVRVVNRVGC
jgi:hypothetical protein